MLVGFKFMLKLKFIEPHRNYKSCTIQIMNMKPYGLFCSRKEFYKNDNLVLDTIDKGNEAIERQNKTKTKHARRFNTLQHHNFIRNF